MNVEEVFGWLKKAGTCLVSHLIKNGLRRSDWAGRQILKVGLPRMDLGPVRFVDVDIFGFARPGAALV